MNSTSKNSAIPAAEPASERERAADGLDYWRQRKAAGLAQTDLLPLAAELGAGVNWFAISVILLMGDLFGSLSPFNGISLRAVGEDALSAPPEPQRYRRIEDLYERLDDLVRGAIRLIPAEKPAALGLSGGRDSRHILFALAAEKRPLPRLITARHFIPGLCERDLAAAQRVAARLGAPHHVVDQPGDRFRPEWDKNLMIGLQNLQHSWGIALARALDKSEILYDGMNGGAILGRTRIVFTLLRPNEPERPSFSTLRERLLTWFVDQPLELLRPWAPPHLISPQVVQTIRDMLFDSFSRYEFFPNPMVAFWQDQHVRRHTPLFTFGMMPNEVVVCPFDTPEMIRFALSLPWEVSCDARFADKTLAHCYPQFAEVPFGEEIEPPPPVWMPDERSEAASWGRLRRLLAPRLSAAGLEHLDKSRHNLEVIARATLLAQAYHWDEHGYLPEAAAFFGPEGDSFLGHGFSRV